MDATSRVSWYDKRWGSRSGWVVGTPVVGLIKRKVVLVVRAMDGEVLELPMKKVHPDTFAKDKARAEN